MEEKFAAEWTIYTNEEEKKEAMNFLNLWMKNILFRSPHMEYVRHEMIDKINNFENGHSLAIKVFVKDSE